MELRQLLASKFPKPLSPPPSSRQPTGLGVLDHCLEGGLSKAALTEIVSPAPSMGSATIINAFIEAMQADGKYLGLVDAGKCFGPDGLSNEALSALLWARCTDFKQALGVTDLLLRDGNLPLVVLDLLMCSERDVRAVPSTYWYRLQRVAESNGSVALIFTPTAVVSSAASTLRLTRRFDLAALDLLREQLTAGLKLETLRTHSRPQLDVFEGFQQAVG